MTVKNFFRVTTIVILMAITLPASSSMVITEAPTPSSAPTTENPRVQQMIQRLEEIRDMNKSELTRLERKELRKEVRAIKKEMKAVKGGVYLSIGAIIIIILLLILIL